MCGELDSSLEVSTFGLKHEVDAGVRIPAAGKLQLLTVSLPRPSKLWLTAGGANTVSFTAHKCRQSSCCAARSAATEAAAAMAVAAVDGSVHEGARSPSTTHVDYVTILTT